MKKKLSAAFFVLMVLVAFMPAFVACVGQQHEKNYHTSDTIVVKDTVFRNDKDISALQDSFLYVRQKITAIEEMARDIDAYEMKDEQISRRLDRIRKQCSDLRVYCGATRKLGHINQYDEGYADGQSDAEDDN